MKAQAVIYAPHVARPDRFAWAARWREPLGDGGYVYMRHSRTISPRCAPPQSLRVLDLADVHLPKEQRGQGVFTAYLIELENFVQQSRDLDALCVRDVVNERLAAFFRRRQGYTDLGPDVCPSFMMLRVAK